MPGCCIMHSTVVVSCSDYAKTCATELCLGELVCEPRRHWECESLEELEERILENRASSREDTVQKNHCAL